MKKVVLAIVGLVLLGNLLNLSHQSSTYGSDSSFDSGTSAISGTSSDSSFDSGTSAISGMSSDSSNGSNPSSVPETSATSGTSSYSSETDSCDYSCQQREEEISNVPNYEPATDPSTAMPNAAMPGNEPNFWSDPSLNVMNPGFYPGYDPNYDPALDAQQHELEMEMLHDELSTYLNPEEFTNPYDYNP